MTSDITVFVNGRPVRVAGGATVREAIVGFDPVMASQAESGQAAVTDGVGRPLPLNAPLTSGGIVRVIRSAGGQVDPEDQPQPSP